MSAHYYMDEAYRWEGEKCVAHEDKGQPITTWRRPIGEKVRSVWLTKTKAGPLLHRGGL